MSNNVIRGMNPTLNWLGDLLAFFQVEVIKIPGDYRNKVLETKKLLTQDTSGLVNTLLDFAIDCASVDYKIRTDNQNLTDTLNIWLSNLNSAFLGRIPSGISSLAREYFRERWKGSSNLVLRTFWEDVDDLYLPTTMFFVDGEDVKWKPKNKEEKVIKLGEEKYYIRVNNNPEEDILIPSNKDEKIFIRRPYESWSARESVPFLIRRGLFRNMKFMDLMSQKAEMIVGKALEHLFVLKKGTEKMLLDGKIAYDESDLKKAAEDLKTITDRKKNESGMTTYTTNFDTELEHLIPDYKKVLDEVIYAPIEKRILAGLGLVDIVEGTSSSRRDSILNPKPFMTEVSRGVKDFIVLLTDILKYAIQENKEYRRKWMNADIQVLSSPIKEFLTKDAKTLLRNIYDRGNLSRKTLTDVCGELDYETERMQRQKETDDGDDELMMAPIIQRNASASNSTNVENEVSPDKIGPEKKNFTVSSEYDEAPYRNNSDLPDSVKSLPSGAQTIWRAAFNASYPKGEDYARKVAWSAVKRVYRKVGDKWVRKAKGSIAELSQELVRAFLEGEFSDEELNKNEEK